MGTTRPKNEAVSAQLFIVDVVSDDFVLPFSALFWVVHWYYPTR